MERSEWRALDAEDPNWTECYCTEGDYVESLMNCGEYVNDPTYGNQKKYSGGSLLKMRDSFDGLNMVDLNGKNVSDWLLKTVDNTVFTYQRYGGFSIGADRKISNKTFTETSPFCFYKYNLKQHTEKFRTRQASPTYPAFPNWKN